MQKKTCNACGQTKDIEAFKICGTDAKGRPYRQNECRLCVSKKAIEPKRDYICVHDPSGMYLEGSQLTYGQVMNTLEVGFLPPGSKWRLAKRKQVYMVKGNEHWHNLIECVKSPDETYLKSVVEKQRLVRI